METVKVYFENGKVLEFSGDEVYEFPPDRLETVSKGSRATRYNVINLEGYTHYELIKENENES